MTEYERIKYEELYRKCWVAQMKKDREVNPRLENASAYARNGRSALYTDGGGRHMGRHVGRPRTLFVELANNRPLTSEATIANKLILKGMLLKDVAEVIGVSPKAMSRLKKRYNLPRRTT
jgi:hypothetical protein